MNTDTPDETPPLIDTTDPEKAKAVAEEAAILWTRDVFDATDHLISTLVIATGLGPEDEHAVNLSHVAEVMREKADLPTTKDIVASSMRALASFLQDTHDQGYTREGDA